MMCIKNPFENDILNLLLKIYLQNVCSTPFTEIDKQKLISTSWKCKHKCPLHIWSSIMYKENSQYLLHCSWIALNFQIWIISLDISVFFLSIGSMEIKLITIESCLLYPPPPWYFSPFWKRVKNHKKDVVNWKLSAILHNRWQFVSILTESEKSW